MAETVAFIGLGAMGLNMARCLLRGGFSVRGFDVRGDRLEQFGMDGGTVCASSAEAGEGADSALVIVLTADQSDEACFGEHGLARSLARGTTIKDLGIVEEAARELAMPMPMSAQATQLFRAAAGAGMLEDDDLAVARLMQQLAGLSQPGNRHRSGASGTG